MEIEDDGVLKRSSYIVNQQSARASQLVVCRFEWKNFEIYVRSQAQYGRCRSVFLKISSLACIAAMKLWVDFVFEWLLCFAVKFSFECSQFT